MRTYDDLDPKFKNLVVKGLKDGDTRTVNKKFPKGHKFIFNEYDREFILSEAITMDVVEVYSSGNWSNKTYLINTTKPIAQPDPPPGRWHRFLVWAGLRDKIPEARIVRENS